MICQQKQLEKKKLKLCRILNTILLYIVNEGCFQNL